VATLVKRAFDFALYIVIALVFLGCLYWLSRAGFDLKSHPVWPTVCFISAIAFGTQIGIVLDEAASGPRRRPKPTYSPSDQ
jgi:hypothetical protein